MVGHAFVFSTQMHPMAVEHHSAFLVSLRSAPCVPTKQTLLPKLQGKAAPSPDTSPTPGKNPEVGVNTGRPA